MSATAAQQATDSCQSCEEFVYPDLIKVTAHRLLPSSNRGQASRLLDIDEAVDVRLDETLRAVPGVGLFRRANSLTAHPTTQGMSMRAVGANAAGRVLVTLDGVPQNDPFGGWIYWSSYGSSLVSEVEVLKGGSAGAYGAQALTGAIDLRSRTAEQNSARTKVSYGGDNQFDLSAWGSVAFDTSVLTLSAGHFKTDGDYLLAEDQRGQVDVLAASEATMMSLAYDQQLGDVESRFALRAYDEERVNGLSLATNETRAFDVSLQLSGTLPGLTQWELVTYYRTRDFANVFASARDDRTTERAVLDQFDVPAWGAGVLARVQFDGIELGMDGRRMSGETNERFRNLGAGFTRQRRAGGDQWTLGFYGEYSHDADWGALSATLRYDRWRTYGGVRDEFNIEDGFPGFASPDRSDLVPNRKGGEWTGRVGFERSLTGAIDLRAAAYKTWRLPTLNEYYRPFRVVNDITEANPNLTPETLYGLEGGFDYEPLNTVKLSATYYRNWLRDGVGNVTIGFGPGFFPLGGFVPEGGVLRQRANVDESITDGIELDARLDWNTHWTLSASYLYARARITKFDAMPDLVGKRPVQAPRHSATVRAAYDGDDWDMNIEGRYAGGQYDDDLNNRRLDAIFTINAGARYQLSERFTLTAQAENLFDAKVVSAVTADGLETLAQRRFWRVGLDASF
jgi:outer membrane receptor protein involved in Fe transport